MVTLFVVSRWLGCKNMRVNPFILLSANPVFLFEGAISGHRFSWCDVLYHFALLSQCTKRHIGNSVLWICDSHKNCACFGIPLTFKRRLGSYLTLGLVLLGWIRHLAR